MLHVLMNRGLLGIRCLHDTYFVSVSIIFIFKDEQNCAQKEKEEPEGSFVILSEEEDDDDILAACIQMGMRGKRCSK